MKSPHHKALERAKKSGKAMEGMKLPANEIGKIPASMRRDRKHI